MKIGIHREAFATALAEASSVAATRTPKPVLQCVLVETHDNTAIVMATDLETSIRITVPQVEITHQGQMLVPADKLTSIVRESRDEIIQIETDDRTCHIRGDDSHFQILHQDPADYPPIPKPDGNVDVSLKAGDLAQAISYTQYAAAKENTRFAINGILCKAVGKLLQLVATDGRRLAVANIKTSSTSEEAREVIIPLRAMNALNRLLHDPDQDVEFRFQSNQVVVRCGGASLSSVLVEGHFPKYEDVIPKDNDKMVELDREEFLRAIRRAALLTTQESRGVRLSFDKNQLELTSRAPDQGEAKITMPIEYDGESLAIGFNPAFLMDVLKVVDADTVTLDFKEPNRPGVVRVGKDFTYVVMPVNLT